ncbi:MAG: Gfo/Idh/MocA family oxidoreductase [Akkermansiaceae bacterium]|nr:Gfo/Idh/MocA family oxidoreductase [Akkermansiaceae bacterium]
MPASQSISRRKTLKGLAALATIQIVPRHVIGQGQTPPSEQLTRGIIGCGGISGSGAHVGQKGPLLALCDVDRKHLENRTADAKKRGHDPKGYHDFRELLARDDLDIIHICTPPHWHALMAIAAAKAGKDIWCEKPMSRTIGEGLAMKEAVEKNDRIFRINTWFRFRDGFYGMGCPAKPLRKAVMHGLLGAGPLTLTVGAHQGFNWKFNWSGRTDLVEQPVPEHFDYDFWLGPAPKKPYHPHRTHGSFRGYWDYDGGGLGDMGQHYLDPVQYILGKDEESPVEVFIDADPQDQDAVGSWRRIEYTYADGTRIILDGDGREKGTPYIKGSEGSISRGLKSDIAGFDEKLKSLKDPEPQLGDFHEAVRERKKFALNESNAFRSATIVNLGTIAHRSNKSFKFDPKTMTIDEPEAHKLISQPMRAPWKLEG